MYKLSTLLANKVFYQNKEIAKILSLNLNSKKNTLLLSGSGVQIRKEKTLF